MTAATITQPSLVPVLERSLTLERVLRDDEVRGLLELYRSPLMTEQQRAKRARALVARILELGSVR